MAAANMCALDEVVPGMRLELRSGERVPVDSVVIGDGAVFDYSIITGESAPHPIADGEIAVAGANNLSGRADAAGREAVERFLSWRAWPR